MLCIIQKSGIIYSHYYVSSRVVWYLALGGVWVVCTTTPLFLLALNKRKEGGRLSNLEALGGDKALDLGHLDGGLLALTTRHLTLEAVLLLHLVSLVESEKLPDASSTLRTQTAGHRDLCTVYILLAYYAVYMFV